MGAAHSCTIASQDSKIYEHEESLSSHSSDMYKDVLKLFKVSSTTLQQHEGGEAHYQAKVHVGAESFS